MTTKTTIFTCFIYLILSVHLLYSCQTGASNPKDTTNTITQTKAEAETDNYQKWAKDNPSSTDHSEANDEIDGSLYRNNRYKFRIRFIDNWTFRKGDSKSTVIKSVQADSGKSISVLVMDYPNHKLENNVLNQQKLNEQKKQLIEVLKLQNIVPTNFQIQNGYLNNFPATIATFNSIARSQTVELEYSHKQIHCINDGKLYNISISLPKAFMDNIERKRINRVIESFVFEKGM
jgi:hypothetical protein